MTQLSSEDFAIRAGCEVADLPRLIALGIIDEHRFDAANANRVRVALALDAAGIDLAALASAMAEGTLSLNFAGQLMFEPIALTAHRAAETVAGLGLPFPLARRLRGAMGLSELEPEQALRSDDLELLQLVAAAHTAGLSEESLARVLRVFGQSVRRTVEAMRDLFRSQVEEPMLAQGTGRAAMLTSTAATRLELQRIGFRALFLLQRRLLEDAVFDNVVTRIQEVLLERTETMTRGHAVPTVAFADLSGFTALTHDVGDAEAAEHAAAFEALAYEMAVRQGGHFIKSLGDGAIILFPEARQAVEASLELSVRARDMSALPLRVGLATGPVVPRDGDIFGRTVNLAARIMGAAERGQVLACADTVVRIEEREIGALRIEAIAPAQLKGFPEPMPLYSLSRSEGVEMDGGR